MNMKIGPMETLAALMVGAFVGAGVFVLGGPSWAAYGFGMLTYFGMKIHLANL